MKSGEIDGYDAVFLSPHKFVGGPGTPGILLMNKSLYKLTSQPPSTCGGGTVAYVNGFNEDVRTPTEADICAIVVHVYTLKGI
jgi:selenocysteine lyase/cysteine desulfurase